MKTVSVNVMNLCAPCHNRCRYCLLSYDGRTSGIEADRAMDYARRFLKWLRDLHQHYQRRYIAEYGLALYDIHDERKCFVRRF